METNREGVRRICADLYSGEVPFQARGARVPSVEIFVPPSWCATGYSMLTLPGGGYSFLSPKSGAQYGEWFASRGITVAVVHFRLGSEGVNGVAMCCDAFAAARHLQLNSHDLNIDPSLIGVIGTSAGGHLAGMLCTGQAEQLVASSGLQIPVYSHWRPAFAVYCYAVLSLMEPLAHNETRNNFLGDAAKNLREQFEASPLKHVSRRHCRSFLWHTCEDTEVTVFNSIEYFKTLQQHGVPAELHLYEKGPHALGLAKSLAHDVELKWASECCRWIKDQPLMECVADKV